MTTAIISARMGSSRLPGKVLLPILGQPMLARQVERVSRSSLVKNVVVATSNLAQDEPIAAFCRDSGLACHRGSESDVLARILEAAEAYAADPVVRLTGDDPLVDHRILDRVCAAYLEGGWDYVANVNPPTYPDGLDVEVLGLDVLRAIHRQAAAPDEREHVTLYLRRRLGQFRTRNIRNDEDLSHLHWAVDEETDYLFVRRVFETLYPDNPDFTLADVLALAAKERAA